MNSLTPSPIALPSPRVGYRPAGAPRGDLLVVSQGASASNTRTVLQGQSLASVLKLRERVIEADHELLVLQSQTEIRFLLPRGLDLSPLIGYQVDVRLEHILHPSGTTTMDLQIEHNGELILWVRNGRVPEPEGTELPVEVEDGVLVVLGRQICPGQVQNAGPFRVMALEADDHTAAFVIAAR